MKKLYLYILIILLTSCTTVRIAVNPYPSTEQEHAPTNINENNLFESGEVVIIRDNWGTPHIYGQTDSDAAFGLAYAHSEDDFITIHDQVLHARGQYTSVYGRGDNNLNALFDYLVGILKIEEIVEKEYESLSEETQEICEGYAQGINYYIETHNDQIEQYIYPLNGKDVVRGFMYKNPFFFDVPIYFGLLYDRAPEDVPERITHKDIIDLITKGSNAFAVSPTRTSDNSTLLAINSHQPWNGDLAWYEAHVHSEEGWNISGGLFPGSPVILVGFNENLGWGHTVNQPDILDIYELTINPDNSNQYYFDGEWLDFEKFSIDIPVKLIGNKGIVHTESAYWSVHGPVIKGNKATYAVRYSWEDAIKSVEQWYKMNKAKNFDEWEDAMSIMAIPMFNSIYGDKEGNIFYLYNAKLPIRENTFNWSGVVPGDKSETLWNNNFISFDNLPKILNPESGFVMNCNNTPTFTTTGENPKIFNTSTNYSGIETKITNRALRSMELFSSDSSITYNDFKQIKFDLQYSENSYMSQYVKRTAELIKDSNNNDLLSSAYAVLTNWDLGTDLSNLNAALPIISFGQLIDMDPSEISDEILLSHLKRGTDYLYDKFGKLTIKWGEINRLIRGNVNLPLTGGPDILRAIYTIPTDSGELKSIAGDAYMAIVQWDTNGSIKAESIHQFGSSITNSNSAHYSDQTYLFSNEELKPAYLDIKNILNNVESIKIIKR